MFTERAGPPCRVALNCKNPARSIFNSLGGVDKVSDPQSDGCDEDESEAKAGICLNTLAPGLIDTDRNAGRKSADPEAWAAYVRQLNWMERAGAAAEMAGAAVFLASDACSFMTGETIVLSGGY